MAEPIGKRGEGGINALIEQIPQEIEESPRYATPMVVVLGLTILNQLSGSQGCRRGLKGGRNSLQTLSEIQIPQGARVVCNLGYLFDLFLFDYQRTYRNGSASEAKNPKTSTMRFSPKNVWSLKKGQNQCQKPHVLSDTRTW